MKKIMVFFIVFATVLITASCGNAHTHEFGEWTTVKAATCTETGTQERVCVCGEKETQIIPTTEHPYGAWTTVKAATCTEAGTQERVCKCGKKETKNVPATGHSFGAWKTVKAATCTEAGTQERVCKCGLKQTQTISATGHNWKNATCTEPKKCTKCGLTSGSALGHTVTTGICTRCGQSVVNQKKIDAINEENRRHENAISTIEDIYDSDIRVNESVISSTMRENNVLFLYSSSYYNSRSNSLQTEISNKMVQSSYCTRSGDTLGARRLDNEIEELLSELQSVYSLYYAAQMEEENQSLRAQKNYEIEEENRLHSKKLQEIENTY